MKRVTIIVALSLVMASPLYCQLRAVVREVRGKVTVGERPRGAGRGGRGKRDECL